MERMDPKTLRYAPTHEWAARDGDTVTVGITKFAVEQLSDVTHVELGSVGRAVTAGQPFGEVESVKSVNDLYAPVSGDISAVNEKLAADPSLVTNDPLGAGWMVKIKVKPGTTLDHLMALDAYEKQIASEGP
jgi:glycine cleavage system H protein